MASILLLEDEEVLRLLMVDLLEQEGHDVIHAGDGRLALDGDLVSTLDLMITDLYMPSVDGMEATMRARKVKPDLKIIAMSGGSEYLTHDFLPHMKDFGATAILRKPTAPDDFLTAVRVALAIPAHGGNIRPEMALAS